MPGTRVGGDTLKVTCPYCGRASRAPREAIGIQGRCTCGRAFVIAERHMFRCDRCGADLPDGATQCPICGPLPSRVVPEELPAAGPSAAPASRPRSAGLVPHKLLDDDEEVLLSCRMSRRYAAAMIATQGVILVAASLGLSIVQLMLPAGLCALFAVLVWVPATAIWWWGLRFTVYAVTDRRVICASGIVARRFQSIPPEKITDTTVSQSVLQRLTGCGNIAFNTAGSSKIEMVWQSVHDPHEVGRQIRRTLAGQH